MKLVAQALSAAAMPVGAENRVGGPELQGTHRRDLVNQSNQQLDRAAAGCRGRRRRVVRTPPVATPDTVPPGPSRVGSDRPFATTVYVRPAGRAPVAAGQDRPPTAALNAALTRLRTTLAQLTGAGAHHQALPLLRRRTAVGAVDWGRGGEQFNALVVAAGEPGIRGRVRAHRHHRGWRCGSRGRAGFA
jgi:hypothetical protein